MAVTKSVNPLVAKLVQEWRASIGASRLDLAQMLGVSKTSVSNWELGQNEPGVDILVTMAGFAEGDWKRKILIQARSKSGLTGDAIASISKLGAKRPNEVSRDFVAVPLVMGGAGGGPPYWTDTDGIEGYLSLPSRLCGTGSELRCVQLLGDSMEPTIRDGTIVAVDGAHRRIDKLRGKIVAARHDTEGVVIKRLVKNEGRDRLASDKPGYDPLELKDGWVIVGRVVWWIQIA